MCRNLRLSCGDKSFSVGKCFNTSYLGFGGNSPVVINRQIGSFSSRIMLSPLLPGLVFPAFEGLLQVRQGRVLNHRAVDHVIGENGDKRGRLFLGSF